MAPETAERRLGPNLTGQRVSSQHHLACVLGRPASSTWPDRTPRYATNAIDFSRDLILDRALSDPSRREMNIQEPTHCRTSAVRLIALKKLPTAVVFNSTTHYKRFSFSHGATLSETLGDEYRRPATTPYLTRPKMYHHDIFILMIPRFPPFELTTSLLVASLTAIAIPGNPIRYAFLVILAYWVLKYSARFTPDERLCWLQAEVAHTYDSLLRAQSICIFDQATLAYENTRLLRSEHLKIELEEDLRDVHRCSWIKYLPAAYRLLRKIAQCTKEVKDIAHRIHILADEKKRKLARAENDAKQDYATMRARLEKYSKRDISGVSRYFGGSRYSKESVKFLLDFWKRVSILFELLTRCFALDAMFIPQLSILRHFRSQQDKEIWDGGRYSPPRFPMPVCTKEMDDRAFAGARAGNPVLVPWLFFNTRKQNGRTQLPVSLRAGHVAATSTKIEEHGLRPGVLSSLAQTTDGPATNERQSVGEFVQEYLPAKGLSAVPSSADRARVAIGWFLTPKASGGRVCTLRHLSSPELPGHFNETSETTQKSPCLPNIARCSELCSNIASSSEKSSEKKNIETKHPKIVRKSHSSAQISLIREKKIYAYQNIERQEKISHFNYFSKRARIMQLFLLVTVEVISTENGAGGTAARAKGPSMPIHQSQRRYRSRCLPSTSSLCVVNPPLLRPKSFSKIPPSHNLKLYFAADAGAAARNARSVDYKGAVKVFPAIASTAEG
ncbi:hypothetical protein C8F01DRAFT_1320921 [Mycena amicta]|nr:hypothetical protein C8F01DRAFT_1320921 [Mycena amicta]